MITLSDESGMIRITDSNKNSVTLGQSGITITSASTLRLEATGDIDIEAGGNLSMKAEANTLCEWLKVDVKAKSALSMQGSATAELKSAGIVTVQGALVKIN